MAKDLATKLAQHTTYNHSSLEVVAGLAISRAQSGGELLKRAERRVKPPGTASLGTKTD